MFQRMQDYEFFENSTRLQKLDRITRNCENFKLKKSLFRFYSSYHPSANWFQAYKNIWIRSQLLYFQQHCTKSSNLYSTQKLKKICVYISLKKFKIQFCVLCNLSQRSLIFYSCESKIFEFLHKAMNKSHLSCSNKKLMHFSVFSHTSAVLEFLPETIK